MFRFTIRDLLWLMAIAAVVTAWLLDRNKIRLERAQLATKEAKFISDRKIARAEADRASLREIEMREYVAKIEFALRMRNINPTDLLDPRQQAKVFMQRALESKTQTANEGGLERAIERSKLLGAPEPSALPANYGEKAN